MLSSAIFQTNAMRKISKVDLVQMKVGCNHRFLAFNAAIKIAIGNISYRNDHEINLL